MPYILMMPSCWGWGHVLEQAGGRLLIPVCFWSFNCSSHVHPELPGIASVPRSFSLL